MATPKRPGRPRERRRPSDQLADDDLREICCRVLDGEPVAERHRAPLVFLLLRRLKHGAKNEAWCRAIEVTCWIFGQLAEQQRNYVNQAGDVPEYLENPDCAGMGLSQDRNDFAWLRSFPQLEPLVIEAEAKFDVKRRQIFKILKRVDYNKLDLIIDGRAPTLEGLLRRALSSPK